MTFLRLLLKTILILFISGFLSKAQAQFLPAGLGILSTESSDLAGLTSETGKDSEKNKKGNKKDKKTKKKGTQATELPELFDVPDTTLPEKLRIGYQPISNLFSPNSLHPDLERIMLAEQPSHSDYIELAQQKETAYNMMAHFVRFFSAVETEYTHEIEEVVTEEADMNINTEIFFDPNDSGLVLLENPELGSEFLPSFPDEVIAERFKLIENIFPFTPTPETLNEVEYLAVKNRRFSLTMLKRKNLYFPMFEEVLAEYDMPDEIKYLAMIESGLRPAVRSYAGAVGLWQFMPRTGKLFGLDNNYYVDKRMDPYASTVAACKYLKYLYKYYKNDWELALAAYNCGPGTINKAMRRTGKKKYWEIYDYLPKQTRLYVPRFVAMAYLLNYAEEHNLSVAEEEYAMPIDTIRVSQFVNLKALADQLNVCHDDLLKLNPELRKGIVPYYAKNYPIKVPASRVAFFNSKEEEILAAVKKKGKYYGGRKSSVSAKSTSAAKTGSKVTHTVRSGDTISEIAELYGVSSNSVMAWNNLSSTRINIGQRLVIYRGKTAVKSKDTSKTVTAKAPAGTHIVKSGENLWLIAKKHGITVEKLRSLNKLSSDRLNVGQALRVR